MVVTCSRVQYTSESHTQSTRSRHWPRDLLARRYRLDSTSSPKSIVSDYTGTNNESDNNLSLSIPSFFSHLPPVAANDG